MTFVNYKDMLPKKLNIKICINDKLNTIQTAESAKYYLEIIIDKSLKWVNE